MNTPTIHISRGRLAAAGPFLTVAALATVCGGLVAAVVAHAPMQKMAWMAAYLVLVATRTAH